MSTSIPFDAWIAYAKPNSQTRLRLFCFPYAGGGASLFRSWSNHLPPQVQVCPVQLPGREGRLRETPLTHLPRLIELLASHLSPYLDLPFVFFGHSMGSLISFELARYLRKHYDLCPMHMFISAHRAPHLPDRRPPIHQLSEVAFIEELRRFGGTPEIILQNAELMHLFLPVLRADFTICEAYTYLPAAPLDCSISAFGGVQDDTVSRGEVAAWQQHTCQSFVLRMLPGDHFFLHDAQAPLLHVVSEEITRLLR